MNDPGEAPLAEILNLGEAAEYLGVSSKTFQKVLRRGDVPARKIGREWKFSRRALRDWVGAGRSRDFLDASDRSEVEVALPVRAGRPASSRRRSGSVELSAEED